MLERFNYYLCRQALSPTFSYICLALDKQIKSRSLLLLNINRKGLPSIFLMFFPPGKPNRKRQLIPLRTGPWDTGIAIHHVFQAGCTSLDSCLAALWLRGALASSQYVFFRSSSKQDDQLWFPPRFLHFNTLSFTRYRAYLLIGSPTCWF
jgi:hypothetical protein